MDTTRPVCWMPDARTRSTARLNSLMARLGVPDYDALLALSVEDPESYWSAVIDDLGWRWRTPWRTFHQATRGPQFAEHFVGAELNWVDNALAHASAADRGDWIALASETEDGATRHATYRDLAGMVLRAASGLQARGVGMGDRVGLMLPQGVEAVVALLALSAIGAIVVPLFTGFGEDAVSDRLSICGAKAWIISSRFTRRGRSVYTDGLIEACMGKVLSLQTVIVVDGRNGAAAPGRVAWEDLLDAEPIAQPVPVPANHPFMVLFTSGTTGRPKGTVHTHAGFPIKVLHDAAYLFDLRPRERWFWPSDMGWVVGPLTIVSALCIGATLACYDGAPDVPDWQRIPGFIKRHRISHFGASPTLIRALAAASVKPGDLDTLRVLISAGEVLDAEHFDWFFKVFGAGRLPIINYTGGTEVSGALLSNVVLRPIKPSGFNSVSPGIHAAVIDDAAAEVAGQVGELALKAPFIGMTQSFWQEDERYLDSYWRQHPGLWVHGDLAVKDPDGHFFLLGRSDDTLKIAGKRLGPAEVEAVVLDGGMPVKEVAAVGLPDAMKGQQLVLCVVLLAKGEDETLKREIQNKVASALGKPFRPGYVLFVDELPKTRNLKVMRRVIRQVLCGMPAGDLSSLENPGSVQALERLRGRLE